MTGVSACSGSPAALAIFARLPVPGKVKTRLAASVGGDAAASFYERMAERAFGALGRAEEVSSRTLFFSEASEAEGIHGWLESSGNVSMRAVAQCESRDLGDRMRDALDRALASGGADGGSVRKAIVVGTDIPDLDETHVDAAARLLDHHDVVFGPAMDGGYYLLGVRRRDAPAEACDRRETRVASEARGAHPALFRGVPWSTPTVLRDSIAAARAAGLSVAPRDALPALRDIDTIEDVLEWANRAPETHALADAARRLANRARRRDE